MFYERQAERYTGSLLALYDASSRLRVTGGAEVYRDLGSLIDGGLSPESLFNGGASEVGYTNGAVFGEGALTTDWVNLTLGARFNRHSQFGSSFVPRLALTKVAGKFHVKALFSKAFRAPAINYIDLNPLIKPERTTVWELEAGYRLSQRSFLSANVFDVTIHKPIVFSFDEETQTDQYQNFSQTGTRGFELDYRYKADRGYAGFTCSYYATAGKNEVDYYRVENHGNLLLAFPPHKWTAHGSIQLARKVSLNPSLVCLGARYGYVFDESTQGPAVHKFNSTLLANLYLRLEDIGGTGLELGAGIFDLFGQNYPFIQPYAGSHAPLPAPSREFVVRFGYRWSFATP
jgi:outer membrane cobalamin receptor